MIRASKQGGLTLVELLLGLAITAILMVPLAAMFQNAASSSITTKASLDLNADARFAVDRIVQRAAAAASVSSGTVVTDPGPWLAPLSYALVGTNLVETDATLPKTPRASVIASNVDAFRLSVPEIGDGQAMLKIELTLAAQGSSVSVGRTVRVGVPP